MPPVRGPSSTPLIDSDAVFCPFTWLEWDYWHCLGHRYIYYKRISLEVVSKNDKDWSIKMFRPWPNVFCATSGTICIRLIMTEHPHLGCCSRIANDYLYWGRERERERALHAHLPCSAQTGNNRQDSHMIMPKQACFHYILCSGAVVCHLFRGFRVRTWILLSLLWGN